MVKKRNSMVEKEGHYRLFEGKHYSGPWIMKNAGTGRVLTHFLGNVRRLVSLEDIGDISGWQDPKRQMRSFVSEINGWSPYQIERVERQGEIYYKMIRK